MILRNWILVADVYEAKANDVDRAVESAKKAFPARSELDGSERRRLMLKLADLVDDNAAEFARLETLSMRKPVATYIDQVMGTANVEIIPMIMICFKVGPALIAGNTLVLKSSEKASLTSPLFARLAKEARFPPGVLNILSGFGLPCEDAIARHMDILNIAFTGSTRTGKIIQKAAVDSNLKSCTLELGGKSPLIVFEDADLEKVAKAAAFSIVSNSGQVCMASSRVYVQNSIADRFEKLYTQAIQELSGQPGNPLDRSTSFGPQADGQQFKIISGYLEQAQKDGLRCLPMDKSSQQEGTNFVSPIVFHDVPKGHPLMKEEIFGDPTGQRPEYGLYASVFTRDLNRAIRVAKDFEAGSIGVNTSSPYYYQDVPLGGFKGSGTGRELGDEGLEAWTEVKSVYISLS
ncbi:Aldehyde/histidinol dehydrogenase [Aspergillus cavernicola]|uniref:aldehyde dehydrogenase (NAD(+)) n=1 Tax=Aspergillus cavernicola TaxID=176166 RepID=A0ABR4HB61_9EURO